MLNFLGPRQVRYVHEAVHTFFQFYEQAEVGQVAHGAAVLGAYCKLLSEVAASPRVFGQLLDAEAHLAVFAVEGQYYCLYRIALLDEVLRVAQVLAPAHFRYVDEAFNARYHFHEGAVCFARVSDAAPRNVRDVQQTIDTAEVDEHAEVGHVLDVAFQNLTFFEVVQDGFALLLEVLLDEDFVRHNHVVESGVDFHHF
nr:hypothetical protein [Tanacetum cinerariifolium]